MSSGPLKIVVAEIPACLAQEILAAQGRARGLYDPQARVVLLDLEGVDQNLVLRVFGEGVDFDLAVQWISERNLTGVIGLRQRGVGLEGVRLGSDLFLDQVVVFLDLLLVLLLDDLELRLLVLPQPLHSLLEKFDGEIVAFGGVVLLVLELAHVYYIGLRLELGLLGGFLI